MLSAIWRVVIVVNWLPHLHLQTTLWQQSHKAPSSSARRLRSLPQSNYSSSTVADKSNLSIDSVTVAICFCLIIIHYKSYYHQSF